jgi:hypothetical protein
MVAELVTLGPDRGRSTGYDRVACGYYCVAF